MTRHARCYPPPGRGRSGAWGAGSGGSDALSNQCLVRDQPVDSAGHGVSAVTQPADAADVVPTLTPRQTPARLLPSRLETRVETCTGQSRPVTASNG